MRRQDGSCGWRVAHDREVIRGCAGEVIGTRAERLAGRVWRGGGNMIGEMKGLCKVSDVLIHILESCTYGYFR